MRHAVKPNDSDRVLALLGSILDNVKSGARTRRWTADRLQRIVNENDPEKDARCKWDVQFCGRGEEVMDLIGPFYEDRLVLPLRPPITNALSLRERYRRVGANAWRSFYDTVELPLGDSRFSDIIEGTTPIINEFESGELIKRDMTPPAGCLSDQCWGPKIFFLNNPYMDINEDNRITELLWKSLFLTLAAGAWSIFGPDESKANDPELFRREKQNGIRFLLHELWLKGNFPIGVRTSNGRPILVVLVARETPPKDY